MASANDISISLGRSALGGARPRHEGATPIDRAGGQAEVLRQVNFPARLLAGGDIATQFAATVWRMTPRRRGRLHSAANGC